MDKKKIVGIAREKIAKEKENSSGEKSFLDDVLGAVMGIVGDNDSSESAQDDDKGGKVSGRKPRSQNNGRAASVGRSVADQLKGKK